MAQREVVVFGEQNPALLSCVGRDPAIRSLAGQNVPYVLRRVAAILEPSGQRRRQLRVDEEVKRQNWRSGDLHYCMPKRTGSVGEAGIDVIARQVRKIGKQFVDVVTRREPLQNVGDADASPGDDRPTAANLWVDDNLTAHRRTMLGGRARVKLTPPRPLPTC